MVLDYSKWDKLQLSDDSDEEVGTSSKTQSSGPMTEDVLMPQKGCPEAHEKVQKHQAELLKKIARLEDEKDIPNNQSSTSNVSDTTHVSDRPEQATPHPPQAEHSKVSSSSLAAKLSNAPKAKVDDDPGMSALCARFLQIEADDYHGLYKFVLYNPDFLQSWEHVKYVQSEMALALRRGEERYARKCAHHWYIHKACNEIGAKAFFQAMLGPPSEGKRLVLEEVNKVYEEARRLVPAPEIGMPEDWKLGHDAPHNWPGR